MNFINHVAVLLSKFNICFQCNMKFVCVIHILLWKIAIFATRRFCNARLASLTLSSSSTVCNVNVSRGMLTATQVGFV